MIEQAQRFARGLLAAAFLAAAVPKIAAPGEFALALFRYRVLPEQAIQPIALVMPWLEALAALALVHRRWRSAGAAWLALLLTTATAAMAAARTRGLDIDCGCFSLRPGTSPIRAISLVRNAALLAILAFAVWPSMHRRIRRDHAA